MKEVRCEKCNKLLLKFYNDQYKFALTPSKAKDIEYVSRKGDTIECKCPRCGEMNHISITVSMGDIVDVNTNKKESVENESK